MHLLSGRYFKGFIGLTVPFRTPEIGGIRAAEFLDFLKDHPNDDNLLATEIVEFMPHKDDQWKRSERLVFDLIESIYLPKICPQ